jgi:hypothetical protein
MPSKLNQKKSYLKDIEFLQVKIPWRNKPMKNANGIWGICLKWCLLEKYNFNKIFSFHSFHSKEL